MDPDANLQAQAEALANRRADGTLHNYDRYALYNLREALRDWLDKGGFAPKWNTHPDATTAFHRWNQNSQQADTTA